MVNGTQGAAHCLRNWAPTDQILCDWFAMEKPNIAETDVQEVLAQVQQIQLLLG